MTQTELMLCRWLDGGVSPFHTVRMAADELTQAGFTALRLDGDFSAVQKGGRYFVENGTSLVAFTVGSWIEMLSKYSAG